MGEQGSGVTAFLTGQRGIALVASLLLLQVIVFWLSMNIWMQISVFCTGPASSPLSIPFGLLHLLLLVLSLFGLTSLRVARLRLPYIVVLTLALILLGVQALLVANGLLTCDGP